MGTKYIKQGLSTYITVEFLFGPVLLKRHRLQLNNIMDKRTKKYFLISEFECRFKTRVSTLNRTTL